MNDLHFKTMTRKSIFADFVDNYFGPTTNVKSFFHYTTLDALCNGIIDSNPNEGHEFCLRASRCDFMNDPDEVKYGVKFLCKHFEQLAIQSNPNLSPETDFSGYEKEMYKQWKIRYLLSLSANGDSLPMWNAYANQATGVAIELKRFCAPNDKDLVLRCFYDDEELKRILISDNKSNDEHLSCIQRIVTMHAPLMLKHPAYKYEEEIRLIGLFNDIPTKVRYKNGVSIPYKEIFFKKEQIQSIKIGPAADSFKVKKLLKAFLKKKKIEIPIKVSNNPYRYL